RERGAPARALRRARVKEVPTIAEVKAWRRGLAGRVGLVPPMGFLPPGPLSLVEPARRENDHVAVSLFVNPTQFGPTEDLARYPREPERARAQLREAGADLLLGPE